MSTCSEACRGWRRAAVVLLCLAAVGLWLGCSERKHYRILSFFFDGVPDPKTGLVSGSDEKSPRVTQVLGFPHKPYADGECKACHAGGEGIFFEATTVDSNVCMNCHQKVLGAHAVMHGPVEARACLWCHAPHGSPIRGMLRAAGAEVCLQCHERELLGSKTSEHMDPKAECLNCHVGHGGPKRNLLRADLPTTAPSPTTSPTTNPSVSGAGPTDGGPS